MFISGARESDEIGADVGLTSENEIEIVEISTNVNGISMLRDGAILG